MKNVIEVRGFSKRYRDFRAVDRIDIEVGQGEIYGFLGLNGAGKTTTIRALLGMIRPNEGMLIVLDQVVGQKGSGPWAKVGHLVESPSAYPELTVRENLEIARRMHGIKDQKSIDTIMEKLSITKYAGRKAGELSMGNLQRLGLARALLHDPELIILDEPINGLDPAGVVEIRELLVSIARDHGKTIFMSSHILTEVELLATRIGIIHKGRMIEELNSEKLGSLRASQLEICTRDNPAAMNALKRAGYSVIEKDGMIFSGDTRAIEKPDEISSFLARENLPPMRIVLKQENLENYFLRLTGAHS